MAKTEAQFCEVTYDELAEFAAGEALPSAIKSLGKHVSACAVCSRRLADLRRADAALRQAARIPPSAGAVLRTRRMLSRETRAFGGEVMTLDEVAEFLRIGREELEEVAPELPAFEVGGQIRVRRMRLLEWIEQRERGYLRVVVQRNVVTAVSGRIGKGVSS